MLFSCSLTLLRIVTGAFLRYLDNARIDNAGVTQSLNETAEAAYRSYVEGFWVSEICWTVAICMIKLSILCYYWRVFTPSRSAQYLILALMAIVACWAVAVVRLILSCHLQRTLTNSLDHHNHTSMSRSQRLLEPAPREFMYRL